MEAVRRWRADRPVAYWLTFIPCAGVLLFMAVPSAWSSALPPWSVFVGFGIVFVCIVAMAMIQARARRKRRAASDPS